MSPITKDAPFLLYAVKKSREFFLPISLLIPLSETPLNACLTKCCASFKDPIECAHSSALSKHGGEKDAEAWQSSTL